jgi:S-formylglutathione hydrolase
MQQTAAPEPVSAARRFGGTQHVFRHRSKMTAMKMHFAAIVPPTAESAPAPLVWFLSGLPVITHSG